MQTKVAKYNILLASIVVVITALVICVVFYQSYHTKLVRYEALSQKLKKESKRFSILDNKNSIVTEYEKEFNKYMPIERFENENRLYWLDALEKIRIKYRIPSLNYTIGIRKPYNYKDGVIKDKGISVTVSDIKLKMSLMHEADLISVTDSLKKIKNSVHIVNSCELKRTGDINTVKSVSTLPTIEANCNVRWYTFKVS